MSLTDGETYTVDVSISAQSDTIGETDEMNAQALPAVDISNRKDFISQWPEP